MIATPYLLFLGDALIGLYNDIPIIKLDGMTSDDLAAIQASAQFNYVTA